MWPQQPAPARRSRRLSGYTRYTRGECNGEGEDSVCSGLCVHIRSLDTVGFVDVSEGQEKATTDNKSTGINSYRCCS